MMVVVKSVHWGENIIAYFIFILVISFSEPLLPVDESGVIKERKTSIRTEMFHPKIKMSRYPQKSL